MFLPCRTGLQRLAAASIGGGNGGSIGNNNSNNNGGSGGGGNGGGDDGSSGRFSGAGGGDDFHGLPAGFVAAYQAGRYPEDVLAKYRTLVVNPAYKLLMKFKRE